MLFRSAADVGADLVGKVEAGIPEDDPRNPATIADNVGDNVGDVAGMGADLFESYVGSMIGAMVLAASAGEPTLVFLPLFLAAAGILVSIFGTFFVKTKEGGNPQTALNIGVFGSGAVMTIVSYYLINSFITSSITTTAVYDELKRPVYNLNALDINADGGVAAAVFNLSDSMFDGGATTTVFNLYEASLDGGA